MASSSAPRIVVASTGARDPFGSFGGSPSQQPRRRRGWLMPALVLLPVVEIAVLVAAGRALGPLWTVVLLFAASAVGVWLIQREGRASWRRLIETVRRGQAPTTEMMDAAILLVGGVLLLVPGLVSDAIALFLLLPFTRPLVRRALQRGVERRVARTTGVIRSVVVDATRPTADAGPIEIGHVDLTSVRDQPRS